MAGRVVAPALGFEWSGDRTGILLIHGFAGSIANLRPIGEALRAVGRTVVGVRLAGHGGAVDDLARSTVDDWMAAVRTSYARLRVSCDRIVVIGESMGALLGLRLAREAPDVVGLVLLAPPFRVHRERTRELLSALLPRSLRRRKPWMDAERAARSQARGSLLEVTVGAYREFLKVVRVERQALPFVARPVLAVFFAQDYATSDASRTFLQQHVPAEQLELMRAAGATHHATESPDRDAILARIKAFVDRAAHPSEER